MADTRKDRRAPISLKVRFKSATVDEFIEQYAKDISRGGIFIKSKKPMAVGTLLKFEFQLKDESRLIHGVGRVVWKRDESESLGDEKPAGMGIKFIKMDPQSRSMVERIVDSRGSEVGTFEGHVAAAPTVPPKAGSQPFFPSTTPESELPKPEDRTQVRHATEFLASALSEADEESAKEAAERAEEARKRTEEIQRERDAEEARRIADEEAAGRHDEPPEQSADESAAAEAAFAAMDAALEQAAREAEGVEDALRSDAVDPLAATIAAPSAPPSDQPPSSDGSPSDDGLPPEEPAIDSDPPGNEEPTVAAALAPGPALPIEEEGPAREPKRSAALPIGIALAAAAGIGLIAWPLFNQEPATGAAPPAAEPPEPAIVSSSPVEEPEPEPVELVSLDVASTPDGADVLIDGEKVGETPASVEIPLAQEVTVTVAKSGFRRVSQTVTGDSELSPLEWELERLTYVVAVETSPAGARVRGIGRPALSPAELTLRSAPTEPITLSLTKLRHERATATVHPADFVEEEDRMIARARVELTPARAVPRTRRATPRETAPTPPSSPAESAAESPEEAGTPAAAEGNGTPASEPPTPSTAPSSPVESPTPPTEASDPSEAPAADTSPPAAPSAPEPSEPPPDEGAGESAEPSAP